MSDRVAGDRTLPTPARTHAGEPACPYCGDQGGQGQAARDLVLRATLPQHIAAALVRTRDLSPRELSVFELLGLGYDNRSLARMLQVSERTTKRHVTAILAKLGLESRLQAGLVALLTAALLPRTANGPKVAWTGITTTDDTELGTRSDPASVGQAADGGPVRGRVIMAFDSLAALRAAGNPVDLLSEEQQAVFASLNEDEVALLNSIKLRLDNAEEADVIPHVIKIV